MNPAEESDNQPDGHCVSYRCRLCRFPIQEGQTVVADVGDGKLTPSFPFSRDAHFEEDLFKNLQGCHLMCPHEEDDQLPAYHVECLGYAPPLSGEFLRATEYSYEPTASEDRRRALRTRDVAGRRLYMACPNLLVEVCRLIAEGLVRECAVIATQELWQGRRTQEALDVELDVSLGVWARYTYIDGIRYVESLSNVGDSQGVLLLNADRASMAELLYVLQDHLGIRQVVFASFEHSVKLSALLCKPMRDAWWRTIPIAFEKLPIKSDGLKLRSVATKSTHDLTDVTWSKPIAPFQEPISGLLYKNLNTSEIEDPARRNVRTVSFELNDPAITGYSVCWANGIAGIHAHDGEEKLAAYDDFDKCHERLVWIYIPVDPGERITGIWTRNKEDSLSLGLMFQTNQGRLVAVGYCTTSDGTRLDSTHLV